MTVGLRLGRGGFVSPLRQLVWLTVALFIIVSAASFLLSEARISENIVMLENPYEYWDAVKSYDITLVYFAQSGCPGCKKIDPAIERFAIEQDEVKVVKAWIDGMLRTDPDKTFELLAGLGVPGTPTLILYRNGVEVARHVSTFGLGDQYEPLKEFVTKSLKGEEFMVSFTSTPTIVYRLQDTLTPQAIGIAAIGGLALGFIAAFSPCSLPMIVLFSTQSTEVSRKLKSYIYNLGAIIGIAIGAGSVLSLLYISTAFIPFNPYLYAVYLAGSFVIAWGMLSLAGRDPMIHLSGRAKFLLPVLGLQCSLPFLIVAITMSSQAPHLVFVSSIMFATAYGLPYVLGGALGSVFSDNVHRIASSRYMKYVQGLFLLAGGLYVIYSNMPAL